QSARAVIPTIITQLLNNRKEIHLGSLHPTRDLNYVGDICKGFISLAGCDEAVGKEINIGSGTEISVGNLAEQLIKLMGSDAKIVSDDQRKRPEKSEVERLVCDNGLIRKLAGWNPEVSLKEGLERTIAWLRDKDNLKRYKWDIYNV
ncbi:MAG: NAD-dependent dehydratase, partial [Nitrospirae bacterium]